MSGIMQMLMAGGLGYTHTADGVYSAGYYDVGGEVWVDGTVVFTFSPSTVNGYDVNTYQANAVFQNDGSNDTYAYYFQIVLVGAQSNPAPFTSITIGGLTLTVASATTNIDGGSYRSISWMGVNFGTGIAKANANYNITIV